MKDLALLNSDSVIKCGGPRMGSDRAVQRTALTKETNFYPPWYAMPKGCTALNDWTALPALKLRGNEA
jgi:hypothetical protein